MKKISLLSFILCLSVLVVLPSCNKDKDDVSNSINFDGTTYDITAGLISDLGSNGNGTNDYDLYFLADGINFSGGSFSGTGTFLYFDLNTASNMGLEEGTYSWSDSREALSIVDGTGIFTDFNASTLSGTETYATGGTVEVSIDGTEVTLTFSLQTNGSTITGTYQGVLEDI